MLSSLIVALGVGADGGFGTAGIWPSSPRTKVAGGAGVFVAQGGGDLGNGRNRRLVHGPQGEDHLAADLRPRVLEPLDQCGNRILGGRPDLPQYEARPVGRLVVLQGFDQPGHGLRARFGDRVEDANAVRRGPDPPAA